VHPPPESDRGTGHAAAAAERHSDAVVRVAEVPLAAVAADATALGDLMTGDRDGGLVATATVAGGGGPGRGRIPRTLATLLGVGTGAHVCMWWPPPLVGCAVYLLADK